MAFLTLMAVLHGHNTIESTMEGRGERAVGGTFGVARYLYLASVAVFGGAAAGASSSVPPLAAPHPHLLPS